MATDTPDNAPEGPSGIITGKITFNPEAVEQFARHFTSTGQITPRAASQVTAVLNDNGPQEAMQALV